MDNYNETYGNIPENKEERMDCFIKSIRMTKAKEEAVKNEITHIKNIKWKSLNYVFYILPKATPRPRATRTGHFYVKGAAENKKFFKEFIKNESVEIITTPIKFSCKAYFPIPKGMNIVEKICAELGLIRPISKPDWDNVAKTYCDMITGLLIYDDNLIIEGKLSKYYSFKPRIEISLQYMEEHDSKFNSKKMKY